MYVPRWWEKKGVSYHMAGHVSIRENAAECFNLAPRNTSPSGSEETLTKILPLAHHGYKMVCSTKRQWHYSSKYRKK